MYAFADVFSCGISDFEAYLYYSGDSAGYVDLERLSFALSGIGYQTLEDDSDCNPILKGRLWSRGYGSNDGNAGACDYSDNYFLYGMSEIYN